MHSGQKPSNASQSETRKMQKKAGGSCSEWWEHCETARVSLKRVDRSSAHHQSNAMSTSMSLLSAGTDDLRRPLSTQDTDCCVMRPSQCLMNEHDRKNNSEKKEHERKKSERSEVLKKEHTQKEQKSFL